MWGQIGALLGGQALQSAGQIYADKKTRDWQQYMSNTAHQRETNDLIAAGLNPILSATGGKGASTPGAQGSNPMAGAAQAASDTAKTLAIDYQRINNEKVMVQANSAKAQAEKVNIDADTLLKLQLSGRNEQLVRKMEADILQTEQSTRTSSAEEARSKAQTGKVDQEVRVLKAIVPFITRGTGAIEDLVTWAKAGGKLGDAAYDLVKTVQEHMPPDVTRLGPAAVAKFIIEVITKHAPHVLQGFRGEATTDTRGP